VIDADAADRRAVMEQRKITRWSAAAQTVAGVLHLHDLWRTELF
jgi:hypothetical protein